ncbi:hypothetical protein P4O66_011447, partial [Electrophorus voltai]
MRFSLTRFAKLQRRPASASVKRSTRVQPHPQAPELDLGAVFGVPLQRLKEAGWLRQGVPLVLRSMVEVLEKYGLQQSGVFMLCGSARRCQTFRVCLDRGECVGLERGDVPTVAALLKLYLRELPCGLIPHTHSKHMQQALMAESLIRALIQTGPLQSCSPRAPASGLRKQRQVHIRWLQEQSCSLFTVCDVSMGRANDMGAHPPTTAGATPLSSRSCLPSQSRLRCSLTVKSTSPSHSLKPVTLNHNTHSNTPCRRSDTSHTHTPRCQSHAQSGNTRSCTSQTCCENRHTQPESDATRTSSCPDPRNDAHSQHGCATCESSTSPAQKSRQAPTHTGVQGGSGRPAGSGRSRLEKMGESFCEQPRSCPRVPVWKATSASAALSQGLGSEQDSTSFVPSSQSHSTELLVPLQQCHVRNLKQAVKSFENPFQLSHSHEAAHSGKETEPNAVNHITDLSQGWRQLKGTSWGESARLRSRQCVKGVKRSCGSTSTQQGETKIRVSQPKPALEDTVNVVAQHLNEKRLELHIPEHMQDMSQVQLALEKNTLQKCLLYCESLHGRPKSREERSVMRDLYNRYRLVKQALYTSNTAINATLDRDKQYTAPVNDTHSTNRTEFLRQMKEVRAEKRRLKKILKKYKEIFLSNTS